MKSFYLKKKTPLQRAVNGNRLSKVSMSTKWADSNQLNSNKAVSAIAILLIWRTSANHLDIFALLTCWLYLYLTMYGDYSTLDKPSIPINTLSGMQTDWWHWLTCYPNVLPNSDLKSSINLILYSYLVTQ